LVSARHAFPPNCHFVHSPDSPTECCCCV
jgi:hypothetical protein